MDPATADQPQRLIAYQRVSTDEQSVSGLGLAGQAEQLHRAFEYEGWQLAAAIADEGISGKNLDRPGLRAALEMIVAGDADGLVVAKLDRLTRSIVDFADLLDWFRIADATLVALDLRLDTSTATGAFAAQLMALVSEWERKTIGERTVTALAAKRARGEAIGRPSLLDAEHTAVRQRILELNREEMSKADIARQLELEGWPTVRGGEHWRASSLQVVLGWERPPRPRRRAELPEIPRRRR